MASDERSRLVQLESDLAVAHRAIADLARASRTLRRNCAILVFGLVASCGWNAYAAPSSIGAVAANDPYTKLSRRMDAIQKQLQGNIDLLELRVRKLEQKPDNADQPDDNKQASAANPGGNGSAAPAAPGATGGASTSTSALSQQVFNLIQRVTSLEHRTVVRAPFIVNDSGGHALFTVQESGGANGVRGVRIFNNSGQSLVTLDASQAGGRVTAIASDSDETTSSLAVTVDGPQVELEKSGVRQIRLWTTDNGDNGLLINNKQGHRGVELSSASEGGHIAVTDSADNVADISAAISSKTLGLRFMKGNSLIAAIGIGANGTGVATIRKSDGSQSVTLGDNNGGFVNVYNAGNIAADLEASDGKGVIAVRNKAGNAVAFLTESSQGEGGNVTLTDPAGNGIVSAGYSASDQGDICLDRKKKLVCVGVNLPLSISQ